MRVTSINRFTVLLLMTLLSLGAAHLNHKPVVTIITGLWDIKRGQVQSRIKRTFDYYLIYFGHLLQTQANLIIFGDKQLEAFVTAHRKRPNTLFINKQVSWFKQQWYTPKIKQVIDYHLSIPEHQHWVNWPQYGLDMYNPVTFSKIFLMAQAVQQDPFKSDYFVWMDGGLLHVDDKSLFVPTNVLQKFPIYFPGNWVYHSVQASGEVGYGFPDAGRKYIKGQPVKNYVWGGYYGGRIQAVSTVRNIFQNMVRITLQEKEMWNEENIQTIMVQRYPYMISYVHNLALANLASITFNNIHHPPAIDTKRHIIFLLNANKSVQIITRVQTREVKVNDCKQQSQGKALQREIKMNTLQNEIDQQRFKRKTLQTEINLNNKLLATLQQDVTKQIFLESIVLAFLLVVFVAMRFGLSDLRGWLNDKQLMPRV